MKYIILENGHFVSLNNIYEVSKINNDGGKYGQPNYTLKINDKSFSYDYIEDRDEIYNKVIKKLTNKKFSIVSVIKKVIIEALKED